MIGMELKKPTEAQIERRNRELWDAAIAEHGTAYKVPAEVASEIGEEIRALHCLAVGWDGSADSLRSVLAFYNVWPTMVTKFAGEKKADSRPEKRKDKYAKLIAFSKANTYKEFTMKELTDESGLSAHTISTWAKATGYFKSRERGKWEARNPADDRRAEG